MIHHRDAQMGRRCEKLLAMRERLNEWHNRVHFPRVAKAPLGLAHDGTVEAWYAFSEVLSWSRTVVERLERPARDRKKFPKQGLIPALRPKRLRKRCENLFGELRAGPVGQARPLANFVLHG